MSLIDDAAEGPSGDSSDENDDDSSASMDDFIDDEPDTTEDKPSVGKKTITQSANADATQTQRDKKAASKRPASGAKPPSKRVPPSKSARHTAAAKPSRRATTAQPISLPLFNALYGYGASIFIPNDKKTFQQTADLLEVRSALADTSSDHAADTIQEEFIRHGIRVDTYGLKEHGVENAVILPRALLEHMNSGAQTNPATMRMCRAERPIKMSPQTFVDTIADARASTQYNATVEARIQAVEKAKKHGVDSEKQVCVQVTIIDMYYDLYIILMQGKQQYGYSVISFTQECAAPCCGQKAEITFHDIGNSMRTISDKVKYVVMLQMVNGRVFAVPVETLRAQVFESIKAYLGTPTVPGIKTALSRVVDFSALTDPVDGGMIHTLSDNKHPTHIIELGGKHNTLSDIRKFIITTSSGMANPIIAMEVYEHGIVFDVGCGHAVFPLTCSETGTNISKSAISALRNAHLGVHFSKLKKYFIATAEDMAARNFGALLGTAYIHGAMREYFKNKDLLELCLLFEIDPDQRITRVTSVEVLNAKTVMTTTMSTAGFVLDEDDKEED